MLLSIFSSVFSFSLIASSLYALYFATSHFWKKHIPPRYNKIALLIILAFFILPIGKISSSISHVIFPKTQINFVKIPIVTTVPSGNATPFSLQDTPAIANPSNFSFVLDNWLFLLACVWLIVVLALLIHKIYVSYTFSKKIKSLTSPLENENTLFLYRKTSENLGISSLPSLYNIKVPCSPFVTGIFKPSIFLPEQEFSNSELTFIFQHELIHYKNKDLWVKLISSIICILHWFNPLVWILNKNLGDSIEKTCDAQVVSSLDFTQRQKYANTILFISQIQSSFCHAGFVSTFSNNKKNMKERLSSMLHAKKHTKKILGISIAAIIALCGVGFTVSAAVYTPNESESSTSTSQTEEGSASALSSTTNDAIESKNEASLPDSIDTSEKEVSPTSETPETTLVPEDNTQTQSVSLINPVPDVKYLSRGLTDGHRGIDLNAPEGADVVAAASGTVLLAGENHYSYGNYLVIDHGNGYTTTYAHCQKLLVSEGQSVSAGQVIALVGHTGNSTGNHLHFELSIDDTLQNPEDYILFTELGRKHE